MKHFIILLTFALLLNDTLKANSEDFIKQEVVEVNSSTCDSNQKIFLSFGANFSHFIPSKNAKDLYWDTPHFCPGGEVLIHYSITNCIDFSTGFNYQCGKIASTNLYYGDRTIFQETTFPLLISFSFSNKKGLSKCFLKTGIYLGKYLPIKRETKGGKLSPDDTKWYDYPVDNSSNFISDLYLGFSYNPFKQELPISLELFSKYRLNEHWLNEYLSRFNYGFKIKYSIKF